MCFLMPRDCKPISVLTMAHRVRRVLFLFALEVAQIGAVAATSAWDGIPLFVKLHSKIEAHSIQNFLDLVQRLLAEVLSGEHLAFAALHQVANRSDVRILQTI